LPGISDRDYVLYQPLSFDCSLRLPFLQSIRKRRRNVLFGRGVIDDKILLRLFSSRLFRVLTRSPSPFFLFKREIQSGLGRPSSFSSLLLGESRFCLREFFPPPFSGVKDRSLLTLGIEGALFFPPLSFFQGKPPPGVLFPFFHSRRFRRSFLALQPGIETSFKPLFSPSLLLMSVANSSLR